MLWRATKVGSPILVAGLYLLKPARLALGQVSWNHVLWLVWFTT